MRYSVLTVARTEGAWGEGLGRKLAEALSYQYIDGGVLDRAAELAGLTPELISHQEKRHELAQRMLEHLDAASEGKALQRGPESQTPGYEALLACVIRERAKQRQVVISAHGAGIPLAGEEGLLRILVTAGKDVRAGRIASERGLTLAEARHAIADADHERAEFFRRNYTLPEESPVHYDLVINTGVLTVDEAAKAVLAIVKE